jgi:(4-(4-[2-(gamma-L-glutamylamino)ethyl]phenoxymethyl)furan-2-yl)methanamine synthase
MQTNIIGWDIGGAHLKAALINERGEIKAILQQPCRLWQGIEQLEQAFIAILNKLPGNGARHILTMTGELVDLFENRDQGVARILSSVAGLLSNREIFVYAGRTGLLPLAAITHHHYSDIASANWLASATCVASRLPNGLFIDIGSTTTDIILITDGQVQIEGLTDFERLISQELVYTGVVRSAVMSIAQNACFKGFNIGLMTEYFATMADIYRITGELNDVHDQTDTADGGPKTVTASARRLSRMIGLDYDAACFSSWLQLAQNIRMQQIRKIQMSCERILSRQNLPLEAPFIGAGVGRFLVKDLANGLGHPYYDFNDLLPSPKKHTDLSAADCAPAIACALLAQATLMSN